MRGRLFILLSVALNVALAGLLLRARQRSAAEPPVPPRQTRLATTATNTIKTQVVVRRQFFTWAEVESDDYNKYIANLRDIGCPEQTIRDIVVADINALFARRRAKEIVPEDPQWWKPDLRSQIAKSIQDQRAKLDEERRSLLTRLLGAGWESTPDDAPSKSDVALTGPILGNLSEATKQAVYAILERATSRAEALNADDSSKPIDPAELAKIRLQTREELGKILSPEQLEEYLLRWSHNAGLLRDSLKNFEVNADEFRALFRARDGYDQQLQLLAGKDDAFSTRQREELEKQRDNAMRQALGADRFQILQYSQDPAFAQARETAQKIEAPPESILNLYQINRATDAELKRIAEDQSLSSEDKEAALEAVRKEQTASLRQLLGEDRFQKLKELTTSTNR